MRDATNRIRVDSKSRKDESSGTGWIRNGTELYLKNSKAEPKCIWNCGLEIELNFRFLFFIFHLLYFQSL
jgi:hypothetical protein